MSETTLSKIAGMNPQRQREVLRSHEESGFDDDKEAATIRLRKDLDRELGQIAELEFRAQAGELQSNPFAEIPHFPELIRNAAFVQYLNSYLYFGVRFAAGRVFSPCEPRSIAPSDFNEPFAGLPSPPICQKGWNNAGVTDAFIRLVANDWQESMVGAVLRFLDGFSESGEEFVPTPHQLDDSRSFELWLRRLHFDSNLDRYFEQLADGLQKWAKSRYDFYSDLEAKSSADGNARAKWVQSWKQRGLKKRLGGREEQWHEGQWTTKNPIAARCALVDFYWLAKVLRADVSARGVVSYQDHSWLYLLAQRKFLDPDAREHDRIERKIEILQMEEVLRAAFGYACDLIQNAVEISEECEGQEFNRRDYPSNPDHSTKKWRSVEDDEQEEIRKHRIERQHHSPPSGIDPTDLHCKECAAKHGWSVRVLAGEYVDNLIGVAMSGGGIRSATFNLGVLQQLQALDLLRHVDYLSTVSGGGYIGAWLVANVRRTRYWLSRMTSWDASIEHLRRYSNYLAPHTGIASPDSWSMWLTWIRNAFLVQLTGVVWLAVSLIFALELKRSFDWAASPKSSGLTVPNLVLAGIMLVIAAILAFSLTSDRTPRRDSLRARMFRRGNSLAKTAAALAWIGCYFTAALLWSQANGLGAKGRSYAFIFQTAARDWPVGLKVIYPLALLVLLGHKRTF